MPMLTLHATATSYNHPAKPKDDICYGNQPTSKMQMIYMKYASYLLIYYSACATIQLHLVMQIKQKSDYLYNTYLTNNAILLHRTQHKGIIHRPYTYYLQCIHLKPFFSHWRRMSALRYYPRKKFLLHLFPVVDLGHQWM